MLSRRRAWSLTAAWALLIFVLSSIPGEALAPVQLFSGVDKVLHLGTYTVLAALAFSAVRQTWALRSPSSVLAATALSVFYGITDEIHQRFVPGRSPDVLDLAADGAGALLGAAAAAWLLSRRP